MNDLLWLAQVDGCENWVMSVLCLSQVGSCGLGVCGVLWLAQVGGVSIGVCTKLLQGQCGLLQETIEYLWLCNFPGALSLPTLSSFSCLLGTVLL